MNVSILHIAPHHVDIRPGQGSHKDVAARRAFFAATGVEYRYVNVAGDQPFELDETLNRCTPSHVLLEYSYLPRIASAIRKRFPHAYIAVRSHNVEPFHAWSLSEWRNPIEYLRNAYVFLRLLGCDARMAGVIDHVYVISPTEAHRYWRWFGIGKKVSWLPYVPPPELRHSTGGHDRNVIACLPGGAQSKRPLDLVNRFARFAQAAMDAGWTQRFVVTGDIAGWNVKLNPAVEQVGYVDDLASFYSTVEAVAILSPIGHGFKTTIADAVCSGATVLVHPTIAAALPEELRPYCVTVNALTRPELDRLGASLLASRPSPEAPDGLMRRFNSEMGRFMRAGATGRAPASDRPAK